MIGAMLIIAGLYLVVWGKSEETKLATAKDAIMLSSDDSQARFPGKSSLVQPLLNSGE
jgi:hypothetical protein